MPSFRHCYPEVVAEVLKGLPANARVLKTDAYNEARGIHPIVDQWSAAEVVEKNRQMLAKARNRWPEKHKQLHRGDIRALPFASESFDLVLDLSTIDHVAKWQNVLEEYARILKPGGKILIIVWTNKASGGTVSRPCIYGGIRYYFGQQEFRNAFTDLFEIEKEASLGARIHGCRHPVPFHADLRYYSGRLWSPILTPAVPTWYADNEDTEEI